MVIPPDHFVLHLLVFPLLYELFGVLKALAWRYTHSACTTHRCAGRTSERTPALPSLLLLPPLYDPLQATAPRIPIEGTRKPPTCDPALPSTRLYGIIVLFIGRRHAGDSLEFWSLSLLGNTRSRKNFKQVCHSYGTTERISRATSFSDLHILRNNIGQASYLPRRIFCEP